MKCDCIILAAGLSSRMDRWKLTLPYKNKTIIETSIDKAIEFTNRIIVIGGHRFEELKVILKDYKEIIVLNNPDYQEGMLSSVKIALPFISTDHFFVSLGDMPLIDPEVYNKLSQCPFTNALFPLCEGKRGHPVLIDSCLKDKIIQSSNDLSMKDILKNLEVSEILIKNRGVLLDVDEERDYLDLIGK